MEHYFPVPVPALPENLMETEELVEPDLPPATLSEGLLSEDEVFKVETFFKDPVVRVKRVNYIFLYKPILIILFSV